MENYANQSRHVDCSMKKKQKQTKKDMYDKFDRVPLIYLLWLKS